MLVTFQGFPAPPGGKKTGAVMENVFVLGYKTQPGISALRRRHLAHFASSLAQLLIMRRGFSVINMRDDCYVPKVFTGYSQLFFLLSYFLFLSYRQ
jgi:tellurite resistance protein TehA-like permease